MVFVEPWLMIHHLLHLTNVDLTISKHKVIASMIVTREFLGAKEKKSNIPKANYDLANYNNTR